MLYISACRKVGTTTPCLAYQALKWIQNKRGCWRINWTIGDLNEIDLTSWQLTWSEASQLTEHRKE